MIVDYHVHTPYCGHATGKTAEYIEHAISLGIRQLGFADHLGGYYLTETLRSRYGDWGMDDRLLVRYVEEIVDLKETYAHDIDIKIGLEVDYVEGAEDKLELCLGDYPFDFLLGSVHCLPKFGWDHLASYATVDPHDIYEEYFRVARAALESGLFQILGHLDFIWRYVSLPNNESLKLVPFIADIVKCAKTTAIEVNANGYVWSVTNPRKETLDLFAVFVEVLGFNNVNVSLGSDAHTPESVGRRLNEVAQLLRDKNIQKVVTFDQKQCTLVPLG